MLPKDTSREVRGPHQDYIIASPSSKRGRGHRQGGQRPTSGLYKHSPSQEEAKDISSEVRSGCIRII